MQPVSRTIIYYERSAKIFVMQTFLQSTIRILELWIHYPLMHIQQLAI